MNSDHAHFLIDIALATSIGDESLLRRSLSRAASSRVPAAHVREAIFQQVVFAGIGRTINAFALWETQRPQRRAEHAEKAVRRRSAAAWRKRGETVCRRIYGRDYAALRRRMARLHPDLDAWVIEEGYGKVMSRPILGLRCRERMAVTVLAALRLWPQLRSHLGGALRIGVTPEDLRESLTAARRTLDVEGRNKLDAIVRRFRREFGDSTRGGLSKLQV